MIWGVWDADGELLATSADSDEVEVDDLVLVEVEVPIVEGADPLPLFVRPLFVWSDGEDRVSCDLELGVGESSTLVEWGVDTTGNWFTGMTTADDGAILQWDISNQLMSLWQAAGYLPDPRNPLVPVGSAAYALTPPLPAVFRFVEPTPP
jgi:hypothetical protein